MKQRRKRILLIENGLGVGGALTSLKAMLDGMADYPYEFYLVCSYAQDLIQEGRNIRLVQVVKRNRLYGEHNRMSRRMTRLAGRYGGLAVFAVDWLTSSLLFARQIASIIKKHAIDLVHLNNGALSNDAGIRGASMAGVPSLVHCRSGVYPTWAYNLFARRVDSFVAISEYVRASVHRMGIPLDRITVVPEGLDTEAFTLASRPGTLRRELGLPAQVPLIGIVGFLLPWKGQDIFLRACARVFSDHSGVAVLAGNSPVAGDAFPGQLKSLAKQLNIGDRVFFLGRRADIATVMADCDIVVHASVTPEPFGRVILEAMCLGKPVIATAAGGPAEFIDEGRNGLLVIPGDVDSMAQGIRTLLASSELRRRIGSAGADKVRSDFTLQRHVEGIHRSYAALL